MPNDSEIKGSVGLEGDFEAVAGTRVAVRLGLKYNDGPGIVAFSGGAGVAYGDYHVDFGIGPSGGLGSMIRVSFIARFGSGEDEGDWEW